MKVLAALASLVAAAAAQSISIASPAPGATLSRGTPTTIDIQRPVTSTAVQDVSVVISIGACSGGSCPDPSTTLGTILFVGPYSPQVLSAGRAPEQLFNVTIPSAFPSGEAELLVTHFALTGTGPAPFTEVRGEILFVR
ncbi:hypothetical protein OF83DRAFT_320559 [Amylostereum chailletii]|nr:hypothetical protein OF83DRAFT_320559 [Amylostereum chailletii]